MSVAQFSPAARSRSSAPRGWTSPTSRGWTLSVSRPLTSTAWSWPSSSDHVSWLTEGERGAQDCRTN